MDKHTCPKSGKIKGTLAPIDHVDVKANMTVNELVLAMGKAGVMGGGKLAKAANILANMIKDEDCTVFFGQAGAMVPGGQKKIIHDMLRSGAIDVFVCTDVFIAQMNSERHQFFCLVADSFKIGNRLDNRYDQP